MPYHFSQPCPACGRQLRIAVQLLGKQVGCQHCGCEFAGGQQSTDTDATQTLTSQPLLDRVDEMLRRSNRGPVTAVTNPLL